MEICLVGRWARHCRATNSDAVSGWQMGVRLLAFFHAHRQCRKKFLLIGMCFLKSQIPQRPLSKRCVWAGKISCHLSIFRTDGSLSLAIQPALYLASSSRKQERDTNSLVVTRLEKENSYVIR